jgi:hypothetical protein
MSEYRRILGLHPNSEFCGVSRFNRILSEKLGTRLLDLSENALENTGLVLLSIKFSELDLYLTDVNRKNGSIDENFPSTFDIFIHDAPQNIDHWRILECARHIYCGNAEIFEQVNVRLSNSTPMWSPSTLPSILEVSKTNATIKFLCFGMAHKIHIRSHQILRDWLRKSGVDFTMMVSASPHEGEDFFDSSRRIRESFHDLYGTSFVWAGYLGEKILLREMAESDCFVSFYPKGLRENNSSAMAALSFGLRVITNVDSLTPKILKNHPMVIDIMSLNCADFNLDFREKIKNLKPDLTDFSWEKLLQKFTEQ